MSNNFKPLTEQVAEKLVEQLNAGTSIFQQENDQPLFMPFNASTGKRYFGAPALILLMKQEPDPRWMTLEQANYKKSGVIKDEKSTLISFYKTHDLKPSGEEGKSKMVSVKLDEPVITTAFLFNAKQLKNMPDLAQVMTERDKGRPFDRINQIVENMGIDTGKLPDHAQWIPRVLAEEIITKKPLQAPIKDELKTTLAALFIAAELKLPFEKPKFDKEALIQLLKDEPAELFKQANDAQKVADQAIGFEKKKAQEQQVATTLNKGDEITYKGENIKVLAILKGKVAHLEYPDGQKTKAGPDSGLYRSLLEAKNNPQQEAIVRDIDTNQAENDQQEYAIAR